ncbi:hypothetical protein E4Z66_10510 [Aliishimia ponticola]|uniref:DUF4157 domain-containing protein n=1 Tax=Aliishimia ponticola TaxID=2499833 RepID=A0A4S4NFH0_9RHOB|nr:hypothetical protein [Aliishimia ponticola]THH37337.1 hypothetical protein E4Z66_10510 [Aliishimia ponticola]
MLIRAFLCLLLLAACTGRPLTESEKSFVATLHGESLDISRVRLVDGAPTRAVTFRRAPRPRTTCRENILPPPTGDIVTAKPAAVTLFNRVLFDKDWYLDDYLPDYPDEMGLIAAMLLAHELTHVWQWQNRKLTGYHPLKAAAEHSAEDPYLFDLSRAPKFLDYGYEQQGAIVEEYVCCRALAPQAGRTKRLHGMISDVMPLSPLPQSRAHAVRLPWRGAELRGICD